MRPHHFPPPASFLAALHAPRRHRRRAGRVPARRGIAALALAGVVAALIAWLLSGGIDLAGAHTATPAPATTMTDQVPLQAMPPGIPLFDFHNWR